MTDLWIVVGDFYVYGSDPIFRGIVSVYPLLITIDVTPGIIHDGLLMSGLVPK